MNASELRAYYAWLQERNEQIRDMRKAGASFAEIAQAFDLAINTIRLILRGHNAPKRLTA